MVVLVTTSHDYAKGELLIISSAGCQTKAYFWGEEGIPMTPLDVLLFLDLITNRAFICWPERTAFQRSAFGRSTAGNDVVATNLISLLSVFTSALCCYLFS